MKINQEIKVTLVNLFRSVAAPSPSLREKVHSLALGNGNGGTPAKDTVKGSFLQEETRQMVLLPL